MRASGWHQVAFRWVSSGFQVDFCWPSAGLMPMLIVLRCLGPLALRAMYLASTSTSTASLHCLMRFETCYLPEIVRVAVTDNHDSDAHRGLATAASYALATATANATLLLLSRCRGCLSGSTTTLYPES